MVTTGLDHGLAPESAEERSTTAVAGRELRLTDPSRGRERGLTAVDDRVSRLAHVPSGGYAADQDDAGTVARSWRRQRVNNRG
jgi:hypothetical protein